MNSREEVVKSGRTWPKWSDRINNEHKLTPLIRKFCFMYVSANENMTIEIFAKKLKVGVSTIKQWLQWPEVKREIERLMEDVEQKVTELLKQNQELAVKTLVNMITDPKTNEETKRKICSDLLGFAGRRDANRRGGIIVNQSQAVVSQQFENMSKEELERIINKASEIKYGRMSEEEIEEEKKRIDREIAELDELENG